MQPKKDSKSSGLDRRAPQYQHMLSGRKTGSFQTGFQLTFPVKRADFPAQARNQALPWCTQQHGALLLPELFKSITTSKALAAKVKHLAPGEFPSS